MVWMYMWDKNCFNFFKFVFGIDNKFAASKIERGHELIRLSKISKKETVIIGDTLHDLEVARALGIDTILISHGHQCPTRLKPHHEMVIEIWPSSKFNSSSILRKILPICATGEDFYR